MTVCEGGDLVQCTCNDINARVPFCSGFRPRTDITQNPDWIFGQIKPQQAMALHRQRGEEKDNGMGFQIPFSGREVLLQRCFQHQISLLMSTLLERIVQKMEIFGLWSSHFLSTRPWQSQWMWSLSLRTPRIGGKSPPLRHPSLWQEWLCSLQW